MSPDQFLQWLTSAIDSAIAFFVAHPTAAVIAVAVVLILTEPALLIAFIVIAALWYFTTHPH